jgi:GxxExxY protein
MDKVDTSESGDPQTYVIINAAMDVHRQLGHGFLEAMYQEAMAGELRERQVEFRRKVELPIY